MSLSNNITTLGGTSLGGTSLGGTSLGGTSLGGTSLNQPVKTSLNNNSSSNLPQKVVTKKEKIKYTNPKNNKNVQHPNKTIKESVIASKIRKLQEDKLAKELEEAKDLKEKEEKRLKEIENEKIQQAIKEKNRHQQQLQLEKNKEEIKQKEIEEKRKTAIVKYGYVPDVIKSNSQTKWNNKIKNKQDIIYEEKEKYEDKEIMDGIKDDWDADSDEDVDTKIDNQVESISVIKMDNTNDDEILDDSLRAPIICVLGHVDAGKTHLLDKIRSSVVNQSEAGQITQQIGASYVPIEVIIKQTKYMDSQFKNKLNYDIPGLIFIDTPGHEPFLNLRSRASSLCDMAILVVDIMVGLQKQTLECIKLLISSKKLFVIALNKMDLLYGWKSTKDNPIRISLKNQDKHVLSEFDTKVRHIWTQFQELGHNTELYYKNKNFEEVFSMVPISAITGEGIPDLLMLLAQLSQKYMHSTLTKNNIVDCTILEVKNVLGRGMTIDVILTNGEICKGDKIIMCGIKGEPIITQIKTILTHSYITRKGEYIQTNKVKASMTCKIDAPNLDDAVSGSALYVIKPKDSDELIETYKKNVMQSLNSLKKRINKLGEGIYVSTSSLGSMEALFEYLHSNDVSIGGFRIGAVHKKDITKAAAVSEKNYACVLAFDVEITDDVKTYAKNLQVKIFKDTIIYKLFDTFTEYINEIREIEKNKMREKVVFPCICRILPTFIFNKHDPIIIGVHIEEGVLKKGTPICIPSADGIEIGLIKSIEKNHKELEEATVGDEVCISIIQKENKQQYSYSRHFTFENKLYSKISRESIDAIKDLYPEFVNQKEIFKLIKKLKKEFGII
jgi:translation initiation factor 5B